MTRFQVKLATAWLLLFSLLFPAAAFAQLRAANHIAVHLVAESSAPAAGRTVTLAFVMTPEPGWHGYWKNPGDAGVETKVTWQLPKGLETGPLDYPVPEPLLISGLMNYVYEGRYALLVPLRLPAGLAPGAALPIAAELHYLACTDRICVPEQARASLDLVVGDGVPDRRAEFDRYRLSLPRPLGSPAVFQVAGDRIRIGIPLPASLAVAEAYFFPLTKDALAYSEPQSVSRRGDMLIVATEAGDKARDLQSLEAVLRIGPGRGLALRAQPGQVPASGTSLSGLGNRAAEGGMTIIAALLGAVLGGLLLNVMPCVFPILSLKALGLARAGGDEGSVRREAWAYAAGVILTCLALGGALLALRAGGVAVGWAFQLQDPRIILLLLLLTAAIALNLAGVFELPAVTGGNALANRGGTAGAFWTGALAAFVATPCTGPFMGAALGAALVLPTVPALAIFAGLGVGLAMPFLLLGLVPALRRRLPRPGSWMVRLQRILAIPMALTTLALGWILMRQAGMSGLLLGLGALSVLAAALWLVGRRQRHRRAWPPLVLAIALSLVAILLVPAVATPSDRSGGAIPGAEPFSEARLAALQAQGRPTFVYFTADWCVTCKVNEKGALASGEVAGAFRRADVAVLVGDWTNGDPAITRFLERQGRSGVPLYLYYEPGKPARTLPQLLTAKMVAGLPT